MAYFAVLLRVADQEAAEKYREAHTAYIKEMCASEKATLVGGLMGEGGLIIYQANHREEVKEWVEGDPFVIHGARRYEIFQWDMHTAAQYINK